MKSVSRGEHENRRGGTYAEIEDQERSEETFQANRKREDKAPQGRTQPSSGK